MPDARSSLITSQRSGYMLCLVQSNMLFVTSMLFKQGYHREWALQCFVRPCE